MNKWGYNRGGKTCDVETDGALCEHHLSLKCVSCGVQATHTCQAVKTSICGVALCDECEHQPSPDGGNGRFYQHAVKGAPLVFPHYAKDVKALLTAK